MHEYARMAAKMRRGRTAEAFGPPITPEEAQGNLSQLEKQLNGEMKCPAGKNQVYIRSLLTGRGTTQPRIALKCPLRKDIGEQPEIFFEQIRSLCCTDHEQCPAWRQMKSRFVDT